MLAIIIVIEGTWLGRERRKCQQTENDRVMAKEVEGGGEMDRWDVRVDMIESMER